MSAGSLEATRHPARTNTKATAASGLAILCAMGRKDFFFEKKKQKT
jgi:hypothetical protein